MIRSVKLIERATGNLMTNSYCESYTIVDDALSMTTGTITLDERFPLFTQEAIGNLVLLNLNDTYRLSGNNNFEWGPEDRWIGFVVGVDGVDVTVSSFSSILNFDIPLNSKPKWGTGSTSWQLGFSQFLHSQYTNHIHQWWPKAEVAHLNWVENYNTPAILSGQFSPTELPQVKNIFDLYSHNFKKTGNFWKYDKIVCTGDTDILSIYAGIDGRSSDPETPKIRWNQCIDDISVTLNNVSTLGSTNCLGFYYKSSPTTLKWRYYCDLDGVAYKEQPEKAHEPYIYQYQILDDSDHTPTDDERMDAAKQVFNIEKYNHEIEVTISDWSYFNKNLFYLGKVIQVDTEKNGTLTTIISSISKSSDDKLVIKCGNVRWKITDDN